MFESRSPQRFMPLSVDDKLDNIKKLMKKLSLILFLLISSLLNGQDVPSKIEKSPKIWNVKEILEIWEEKGLSASNVNINPVDLIYINSELSRKIIDLEFKSNFLSERSDSAGIYKYDLPVNTIKIAEDFKEPYAAKKIFDYYKNTPKYIKSDTIYYLYNGPGRILSILIHYEPKGLKERLKQDYHEWKKIAKKAPSKSYPTLEEWMSQDFSEKIKIKESDLLVDCNYILFQLAWALKKLGVKGFNNDLINRLKKKQTHFLIDSYEFPTFFPGADYDKDYPQNVINLENNYDNISELVSNFELFKKVFFDGIETYCNGKITEIVHNNKNIAYLETSDKHGYNGYRIKLSGNKLIVERIWSII